MIKNLFERKVNLFRRTRNPSIKTDNVLGGIENLFERKMSLFRCVRGLFEKSLKPSRSENPLYRMTSCALKMTSQMPW